MPQSETPKREPFAPTIPDWPAQPSGKAWDDFAVQLSAAATARIRLARTTLMRLVADCDECHGKRCQYCESTWKIIDQLEVPPWLR